MVQQNDCCPFYELYVLFVKVTAMSYITSMVPGVNSCKGRTEF